MAFCSKCGKELPMEARFCFSCGTPVDNTLVINNTLTERKFGYEGEIYKCPNCGDVLDAYEIKCETCGWERRGSVTAHSVAQFIADLEKIESKEMKKANESILKKLIGFDLNWGAEKKLKAQKEKEKIQCISNYIIPNTKEDILEFLQLAISKLEGALSISQYGDEEINAWIMKFKQCDQKAKIMLAEDKDYLNIQAEHYKIYKKYKVSRAGEQKFRWFK